MPRQTFITKEFFVNASEIDARQNIMTLPTAISNIKLVAENQKLHSVTFAYERANDVLHHIAISLLPLNDSHTQIIMHASNANGSYFYNDPYVTNAVVNFEQAICAAVKGNLSAFEPVVPKKNMSQKLFHLMALAVTFVGLLYLWKKIV